MAFGFIGDIVESVADVFLPEKGTRGATIGSFLTDGSKTGAAVGAAISRGISSATASGKKGQGAVSTPTAAQSAKAAPESSESGQGLTLSYAPTFTDYERAGVPLYASTGMPQVYKPGAVGMAETVLDVAYNVGDYFFGGDMGTCGTKPKQLVSVRQKPDGSQCLSVTRKQQHQLKMMVMYMGIEQTAGYLGLSVPELASLLVKKFPPRRKGISAAQLRNAKRVNRTVMNMAKQLTDACKTTTRRR